MWGFVPQKNGGGGEGSEVEHEGDVAGGEFAHGCAAAEVAAAVHFLEGAGEVLDVADGGEFLADHDAEESAEAEVFDFRAACHLGVFFGDVLVDGFAVEDFEGEACDGAVGVEAEGEVDVAFSFVGLLVEVDGADAVLDFLEVRCDIDDVVDAAHVS